MNAADTVLQESFGFAPRGKYHLTRDGKHVLCHARASTAAGWNVHGKRALFEQYLPERICKNCRKSEQVTSRAKSRLNLIPTLEPKAYKPRCRFGQGHIWVVVGDDGENEVCQCSTCGTMSSNWQPVES